MYDFSSIADLLPFFSQILGREAEILLCDTQRILYAEHPISDRVNPGNPLGDMERSFIEDGSYQTGQSVVNYRAMLPSGERLRSSTYFLKNKDGSLAGFLTINVRVENLIGVRDLVDKLINGESAPSSAPKTATLSRKTSAKKSAGLPPPHMVGRYDEVYMATGGIINTVIGENLKKFGVSAERLTTAERQQIVQELDQRGVFLVKGAVDEVAKLLGCAEVTIYRYLQHTSN